MRNNKGHPANDPQSVNITTAINKLSSKMDEHLEVLHLANSQTPSNELSKNWWQKHGSIIIALIPVLLIVVAFSGRLYHDIGVMRSQINRVQEDVIRLQDDVRSLSDRLNQIEIINHRLDVLQQQIDELRAR